MEKEKELNEEIRKKLYRRGKHGLIKTQETEEDA